MSVPFQNWFTKGSVLAAIAIALFSPRLPGQPAKAVAKAPAAGNTARTPDGYPDLHGFWTNATFTPMERSPDLGTKEFFTPAEAAAYERDRRNRDNSQAPDDLHYDNVAWQTENYSKGVSSQRTSLIFDPRYGRIPPFTTNGLKLAAAQTEKARRRNLAGSASERNPAERCISWGAEGPPMLGTTYNSNLQIVQTSTLIAIYNEMVHNVRMIPLDGQPHLRADLRQWGGDSRGHWEGNTLVVDSTNFSDETPFRGPPATARQDIFSSSSLHVVERFTRLDTDTIAYRFTIDDPGVWTKPWSGEILIHRFEGPILEYACHEGNYGLANILAGARAAEQKDAERTGK